jgi:NADPH:quinone reductase-like Zn-dependent oxidoreductase
MKKLRQILKWALLATVLGAVAWLQIAYWTSTNNCAELRATEGETMKAIVYCDYGPPEVLRLETVRKPVPNDNQVLVKVRAASVNPYDWHFMRGEPFIMRIDAGLRKPKEVRLGIDFSGTVEAVGRSVTQFKPGDAVFGGRSGSFAEYVVISEKNLMLKPENVTFEQAGGVQIAGITALQGLRDHAKVQPGEKVLINGASGGVGTFAVQIAKQLGAHVTGVSSTRNVEMVRSLGADEVVDYTKEDFTKGTERYDAIIDLVGNHGIFEVRRALTPNGRYVMIGGRKGKWLAPMDTTLKLLAVSPFVRQDMKFMLSKPSRDDLQFLAGLMADGKLTTVIDRTYTLTEAAEAMRHLETGRARGKIIITVP